MAGEPDTFNPLAASDSRSRIVAFLTSATLLETTSDTNQVTCGVCEEFRLEPGALKLTLTLREGLRFSDGAPVTAADVEFVFEQIYAEDSQNVLRELLLIDGLPIRLELAGPRQFRFIFPRPCPACPYLLAQVPLLPRHLLADRGKPVETAWTLDTRPAEMAGLGPFRIARHEPGVRTVLEANRHYWRIDRRGIQLPYLDELHLEFVPDRNNRLLRLQAGSLDLVDQILQPEDWQLVQSGGSARIVDAGASSTLSFFWFNLGTNPQSRPWFHNPEFRHGVSAAIRRQDIVDNVYRGFASPAYSIVSSAHGVWRQPEGAEGLVHSVPALERFRRAGLSLESSAAGSRLVDTGGRQVAFELVTRTDEAMGRTAALIQQDLAQVGIDVRIRQEEFRTVIARITGSRDYEAALMTLDIPLEPSSIANLLLSSGPMHVWNPSQGAAATAWEREIDQLMHRISEEADPQVRIQDFRQVQAILVQSMPLVPLVNRNVVVAVSNPLDGVVISNHFPYSLAEVWRIWRNDEVSP